MLGIQTNVGSLMAQRNLGKSQIAAERSFGRLSSGYRIQGARDDAAGLAIAESLRGQRKSMVVAERNAADAVSMVQTAEGALGEVSALVQRMRELAVQAANGALSDADRGFAQTEFSQLQREIARVFDATTFNGVNLLGDDPSRAPQFGTETVTSGVYGVDFTWADGDTNYDVVRYDVSITYTPDPNVKLGRTASFQVGIANTESDRIAVDFYRPNLTSLLGVSSTGTVAASSIPFPGGTITTYEGTLGSPNSIQEVVPAMTVAPNISSNAPNNVLPATIATAADARAALDVLDDSLRAVSEKRAYFGALMNRFDVVVSNLQTQRLSVTASESRIRDVDVAAEASAKSASDVAAQAGTSVLAQANNAPQGALALLKGG